MRRAPSQSELLEVVGDLQLAAFRNEHWDAALARIGSAFGADTTGVQLRLATAALIRSPMIVGSRPGGWSPEAWASYGAHYATLDVVSAGARRLGPGASFRTNDVVEARDLHATEFWCDWAHPNGLDWLLATSVHIDGHDYAALGMCRSLARGEFAAEQAESLRVLRPHIERAIQLSFRLRTLEGERDDLADAIDRLSFAVLIVDEVGFVVHSNAEGERILARRDGLARIHGRLCAVRPGEQARLERVIAQASRAARGLLTPPGGVTTASRRSGRALQLLVTPLPVRSLGRHAVAIFVSDPDIAEPPPSVWLARLYGLTPSEARVAALIAQGLSPAEAAERLDRSVETVRRQLKLAMHKLGVRRQPELVRLVLAGLPFRPRA